MSEEFIIEVVLLTLKTVGLLVAPPVIAIVVVGLVANILQTITQLKDQALSFVPKIIVVGIVMVLALPWYMQIIQEFAQTIFEMMRSVV